MKKTLIFFLVVISLFGGLIYQGFQWRSLPRKTERGTSAQLPSMRGKEGPTVAIFEARNVLWMQICSSHSWVAYRKKEDASFTVTEVVGSRKNRNARDFIEVSQGDPDRFWRGQPPILRALYEGEEAERAIETIEKWSNAYLWRTEYRLWPGPNSNSFVGLLMRSLPSQNGALSSLAIGKDHFMPGRIWVKTPETLQLNYGGLLGWSITKKGFYFHLGGLTWGVELSPFDIVMPGKGSVKQPW